MEATWSFLSNYGLVLIALAQHPELRLREIAQQVGITPRAVQTIVTNLVEAGFPRAPEGRTKELLSGSSGPSDRDAGQRRPHRRRPDRGSRRGPRTGPPREGRLRALVLGCSDHRFQEPLRELLASLGMLAEAEVVLWPGGAASLTAPDGRLVPGHHGACGRRGSADADGARRARGVPRPRRLPIDGGRVPRRPRSGKQQRVMLWRWSN